jgi:hypothetical protein
MSVSPMKGENLTQAGLLKANFSELMPCGYATARSDDNSFSVPGRPEDRLIHSQSSFSFAQSDRSRPCAQRAGARSKITTSTRPSE